MKKFIAIVSGLAFLSPAFAFAQTLTDINSVSNKATNIGGLVISLAISLSVIWIIISVVRYLIAGGEEDRKKGGMAILWGVVGLFVILSIWGLVNILRNSFKTDPGTTSSDVTNVQNLPTPHNVPN